MIRNDGLMTRKGLERGPTLERKKARTHEIGELEQIEAELGGDEPVPARLLAPPSVR